MSENEIAQKITALVAEESEEHTEYVVIPQARYESLLEGERVLSALEAGGVDNWSGYGFAMDMLRSDED